MTPFHVGMKVVCVDATPRSPWKDCELVKGNIYTIRALPIHPELGLGIKVMETESRGTKWGFYASRFRPIVKTDISIFQAMLAPKPSQKEMAKAYREAAEKWNREHA